MAVHYILDGYNVIHKIPSLVAGTLEARREGLIRILEVENPQGSVRNAVTIVFDGRAGMGVRHESTKVRIIFSCDETADEKIKEMVESADLRKNIVVVTDDKAIRFYVRKLGAQFFSVEQFFGKGRRGGGIPGDEVKKQSTEKKEIPHGLEQQITSELEDIWLKRKLKKR